MVVRVINKLLYKRVLWAICIVIFCWSTRCVTFLFPILHQLCLFLELIYHMLPRFYKRLFASKFTFFFSILAHLWDGLMLLRSQCFISINRVAHLWSLATTLSFLILLVIYLVGLINSSLHDVVDAHWLFKINNLLIVIFLFNLTKLHHRFWEEPVLLLSWPSRNCIPLYTCNSTHTFTSWHIIEELFWIWLLSFSCGRVWRLFDMFSKVFVQEHMGFTCSLRRIHRSCLSVTFILLCKLAQKFWLGVRNSRVVEVSFDVRLWPVCYGWKRIVYIVLVDKSQGSPHVEVIRVRRYLRVPFDVKVFHSFLRRRGFCQVYRRDMDYLALVQKAAFPNTLCGVSLSCGNFSSAWNESRFTDHFNSGSTCR